MKSRRLWPFAWVRFHSEPAEGRSFQGFDEELTKAGVFFLVREVRASHPDVERLIFSVNGVRSDLARMRSICDADVVTCWILELISRTDCFNAASSFAVCASGPPGVCKLRPVRVCAAVSLVAPCMFYGSGASLGALSVLNSCRRICAVEASMFAAKGPRILARAAICPVAALWAASCCARRAMMVSMDAGCNGAGVAATRVGVWLGVSRLSPEEAPFRFVAIVSVLLC
ncbi:hypothetical protein Bca101_059135 [Brassica carinata]